MTRGVLFDRDTGERLARMLRGYERAGGTPQVAQPPGRRGVNESPLIDKGRLCVVVDAGPDGEEDYKDARYWVQTGYIKSDDGKPTELPFVTQRPGDLDRRNHIVTATNLAEVALNDEGDGFVSIGHSLPVGTPVFLFRRPDSSTPVAQRWLFWRATIANIVQVRVLNVRKDYLEVTPVPLDPDKPNGDQIFNIAKPWLLRRRPYDGQGKIVRDGISYTYQSNFERTASRGEGEELEEEKQVIIPQYWVGEGGIQNPDGDILYAGGPPDGLNLDEKDKDKGIELIDLNLDGRAWAQKCEDE